MTELLTAGRVGRPHGLDGSFHVAAAVKGLLTVGREVFVGDVASEVVARKGTDEHPIVRLGLASDRAGAEALRGSELRIPRASAPPLEEDEYWATDLVGCEVSAGERALGRVVELLGYPSCDLLQLDDGTLIPLVRDAIVAIDVAARRVEVDGTFLGIDGG